MPNSILLFRSLTVLVLLVGFAHLFAYATHKIHPPAATEKTETPTDTVAVDTTTRSLTQDQQNLVSKEKVMDNPKTDYIVGKWKVTYDTEDYKGAIVYELKKEGKIFNAYSFQYEDENGYAQKAEGTQTLSIHQFDGLRGKGIYRLEYEGEKYEISGQIEMVNENTMRLSYEYYGYSDVETWKRF